MSTLLILERKPREGKGACGQFCLLPCRTVISPWPNTAFSSDVSNPPAPLIIKKMLCPTRVKPLGPAEQLSFVIHAAARPGTACHYLRGVCHAVISPAAVPAPEAPPEPGEALSGRIRQDARASAQQPHLRLARLRGEGNLPPPLILPPAGRSPSQDASST